MHDKLWLQFFYGCDYFVNHNLQEEECLFNQRKIKGVIMSINYSVKMALLHEQTLQNKNGEVNKKLTRIKE